MIIDIVESRYYYPRRKVLTLTVELPFIDEAREVRDTMEYLTDFEQESRDYLTVFGHVGPFLERFNISLTPPEEWPNTKPSFIRPLDGKMRAMWIRTYSSPHNGGSYLERIEKKAPVYWVPIEYCTTNYGGNRWTTNIRSDVLEEHLLKRKLNWKVVPPRFRWPPTVEPASKKPHKIKQRIYPSAHQDGCFGAIVTWSKDDWDYEADEFLGSLFPSEALAQKAIDDFLVSKHI